MGTHEQRRGENKNSHKELEEINKMRKSLNLPLIVRENKNCNECGIVFYALDSRNEPTCPKCLKHRKHMTTI